MTNLLLHPDKEKTMTDSKSVKSGLCEQHGHSVTVRMDHDGNVRAEVGMVTIDPLPDGVSDEPIFIACQSCISKVRALSMLPNI